MTCYHPRSFIPYTFEQLIMSASVANQLEENSSRNGALSALSAYLLWGFAPIYFKLLTDIEPGEILMHRVIWSTFFLLVMIILMKKWPQLVAICRQPKILLQLSLSASFLGVNWFLFIWAVNNNHLLDASLGYYINPLFNVILGMIFFNERFTSKPINSGVFSVSRRINTTHYVGHATYDFLSLSQHFCHLWFVEKKAAD